MKSITLNNFRQYKGENTLEFSTDPESNVTVFLGDNGTGKSTLIQAFMWAFFETINLENPKDILNYDVAKAMYTSKEEIVSVAVDLIHDNTRYIIERKALFKCTNPGKPYMSGNPVLDVWHYEGSEKIHANSNEARDFMNKIMPEELSGYFFFDGEHIEKLHEVQKDRKDSISRIMGLTPLKNAVKHLEKAAREFENRIPESYDSGDIRKINSSINSAESALEAKKSELVYLEKAVQTAQKAYDEAHEVLISNNRTIELTKAHDRALEKRDQSEGKLERQIVSYGSTFNSQYFYLFADKLFEETLDVIDKIKENGIADEGVPHMNADSIDYILRRGKCICGTDLKDHPEMIEHIMQMKEYLPPKSIGAEISSFMAVLKEKQDRVKSSKASIENSYGSYLNSLQEWESAEANERSLLMDLSRMKGGDVEKITKDYEDAKNNQAEVTRRFNNCQQAITDKEKEIKNLKEEKERMEKKNSGNTVNDLCKKYAKVLAFEIEKTHQAKEQSMLREFNEVLSEVFSRMYHGERTVELDSSYNPQVYVKDGGKTSLSTGTKVVLGFAYVCALLKLARAQLNDANSELKSEPYPLVMDAPSSNQDDKHIVKVFEYTSSVAEQIILFIMDKDWNYAKAALGSKVDRMYRLHRVSETETDIRAISGEE